MPLTIATEYPEKNSVRKLYGNVKHLILCEEVIFQYYLSIEHRMFSSYYLSIENV